MALLAAYCAAKKRGESLEEYLENRVFADAKTTRLQPDSGDVAGFEAYMQQFKAMLSVEKAAIEQL